MPELPEVETTRRGLMPALKEKKLVRVIKRRDKIRIDIPVDFVKKLEGRRVTGIERRAKYLRFYLDSDDVIICHLGMSGKFVIRDLNDQPFDKHDHIIFETDDHKQIIYNDPRRFGLMTLCHIDDLDDHKLFRDMAAEPLGNEFNGEYLLEKIGAKKVAVKTALLDQKVVVGLGNIYVCEALNKARISPTRKACDITPDEAEKLVPIVREILIKAIDAGGSSLKDFAGADGDLGYFQHQFVTYGREGEDCVNDDCSGVIERIIQGGRSTFYCPDCQK